MCQILQRIPPSECSPYLLRRVSRPFRGFYNQEATIWISLLSSLQPSGPDDDDHHRRHPPLEWTMEEARRQCALALQEPWHSWLETTERDAFRRSGWTTLQLRSYEQQCMPLYPGEFTSLATTLRTLSLSACWKLEALPEGIPLLPYQQLRVLVKCSHHHQRIRRPPTKPRDAQPRRVLRSEGAPRRYAFPPHRDLPCPSAESSSIE